MPSQVAPDFFGPAETRVLARFEEYDRDLLAAAKAADRRAYPTPERRAAYEVEQWRDRHDRWMREARDITICLEHEDDHSLDRRVVAEIDGCTAHCSIAHLFARRAEALVNAAVCDAEMVEALRRASVARAVAA